METTSLVREFNYNGAKLVDPSPKFSLAQVRDFYANTYPEIINAEIEGPKVVGARNVYTFRRAVGTKGMSDSQCGLLDAVASIIDSGTPLPARLQRYVQEINSAAHGQVFQILPEEARFLAALARRATAEVTA
jgi:PRTRC genetic system protein C